MYDHFLLHILICTGQNKCFHICRNICFAEWQCNIISPIFLTFYFVAFMKVLFVSKASKCMNDVRLMMNKMCKNPKILMVTDFLQHSKIQWKILWMILNFQDGLQKHVIPAALYKWVVMCFLSLTSFWSKTAKPISLNIHALCLHPRRLHAKKFMFTSDSCIP